MNRKKEDEFCQSRGKCEVIEEEENNSPQISPDWQMRVFIGKQLQFQVGTIQIKFPSDMIIYSEKDKQIIMLVVKLAWEENMDKARERKLRKYLLFLEELKRRAW